jgi:hypothetical protein
LEPTSRKIIIIVLIWVFGNMREHSPKLEGLKPPAPPPYFSAPALATGHHVAII